MSKLKKKIPLKTTQPHKHKKNKKPLEIELLNKKRLKDVYRHYRSGMRQKVYTFTDVIVAKCGLH